MRLLCDANVGRIIASALADAGHDVVRVIHRLPDAPDDAILAHAIDDARILVTCDSDFGALVFRHAMPPPPAIVFIRFEPADVRDIVPRLLRTLDHESLNEHMTVIGPDGDRRRPFPARSTDHG